MFQFLCSFFLFNLVAYFLNLRDLLDTLSVFVYAKTEITHCRKNRYLFFINRKFVYFSQVACYSLLRSVEICYQCMQKIKECESTRKMKRKLLLDWSVLSASVTGHCKNSSYFYNAKGITQLNHRHCIHTLHIYIHTLYACVVYKKIATFKIYKRIKR